MADRMGEGEPHVCVEQVKKEEKVRADLQVEPISGAINLYTDGCCYRDEKEGLKAAYAVVKEDQGQMETVKVERLQGTQSAQRAEVVAVIEALKWGQGKTVNIYTDSAYAVSAVHVELGQWQRAGFLTATGKAIKHEQEMKELAEALLLPGKVAVIKCKGHDRSDSVIAKGNEAADQAAKKAAGYNVKLIMICAEDETEKDKELERIGGMQKQASPEEKTMWRV